MNKTTIQWTDLTVQLVRFRSKLTGRVLNWCQKISAGCTACYAERLTRRFHGTQHSYTPAGRELVEPFLDRVALRKLVTTRKRGRVFVEDMSDLFGDWVPDAWLDECFAAFALSPLTVQVLTKRAERMRAYVSDPNTPTRIRALRSGSRWPLPGVWLGVSVEDRSQLVRLDHLRRTPAAVRFASFEPLLEDLGDLTPWLVGDCLDCLGTGEGEGAPCEECGGDGKRARLDWVILGGESGPQARPCDVAWVRSILDQCQAAAVACFIKQEGSHAIARSVFDMGPADFTAWDSEHAAEPFPSTGVRLRLKHSHGGDPAEWPEDMRVREFPEVGRG